MTQKILTNDTFPTIHVAYYVEEVGIDPLDQLQKEIEMQETNTRLDNAETIVQDSNIQYTFVMTETGTNINNRKRKLCQCDDTHFAKIRKLEEENKKLQDLYLKEIEKCNKELEKQKEIFQIVLDKEAMKKKLNASNLKCKLLLRKTKRREKKITNMSNLLTTLKKKYYDIATSIFNKTLDICNIKLGFFTQVLEILEKIPDEDKDCALIFDSMAIRQQLCWSQTENKFVGYLQEIGAFPDLPGSSRPTHNSIADTRPTSAYGSRVESYPQQAVPASTVFPKGNPVLTPSEKTRGLTRNLANPKKRSKNTGTRRDVTRTLTEPTTNTNQQLIDIKRIITRERFIASEPDLHYPLPDLTVHPTAQRHS
ncbi:hypothetical protein EAG_07191 [Camponotus floridanus]|uniref:Transposable element P transposase-like RNase H domain-containing protein n=1 Tax=Camponotus floridanus TaxID=104421 RepID=E2ASB5_CAMFO|nr:hypothetical protein EAG_07191 [Camponotus floridanus]